MSAVLALIRRDLKLALTAQGPGVLGVAFFAIVTALAPLTIGPEPELLGRIAPGLLWIGVVLASLLSLDRLFQADFEDESLDSFALAPVGLAAIILAKVIAQWITAGVPVIVAAPLLAIMLRLDGAGFVPLMLGLVIGTPALFLWGALGAALTLGLRRTSFLVALIVLPLQVPVAIFAVAAVEAALTGGSAVPSLMIEAALVLSAVAIVPVAGAAALRAHLS